MSARLESGKFNLDKRGIFKNKMNIHHSQVPGQTNFLDFSLKAVKYKQDTDVIITGRSGWVCTHFSGIGLFVYKDLTTNTFSHWSSYSRPGNTLHHGSSSRVNTSYFWSINSDEWPDHEDQDCHHFCTKHRSSEWSQSRYQQCYQQFGENELWKPRKNGGIWQQLTFILCIFSKISINENDCYCRLWIVNERLHCVLILQCWLPSFVTE